MVVNPTETVFSIASADISNHPIIQQLLEQVQFLLQENLRLQQTLSVVNEDSFIQTSPDSDLEDVEEESFEEHK